MLGREKNEDYGGDARTKKLRESFLLAVSKVVDSLSKEKLYLGFPGVYRDQPSVLDELQGELISKLRESMHKEFEELNIASNIYSKLVLIDRLLRKDTNRNAVLDDGNDDDDTLSKGSKMEPPIFQLRKRFKVLNNSEKHEKKQSENEVPALILGNAELVTLKVLETESSFLSTIEEQLSALESSNVALATELSTLYNKYNQVVSETNKYLSDMVPDPIHKSG